MTNDIILTTKDHEFANTVIDDGVGVADLDFTFKIQRRLDDKYWNDTSKEWQVASIENDASYRAAGVYYIAVVASEFFGSADFSAGIDVTYYAEDTDDEVVVNYTEFFDCSSGTPIDKLDIRNSMTLDATDTPESASIDTKLIELKVDTEQIINDMSTDKTEVLEAISDVDADIQNILATLTQYTPMDKVVLRNNLRLLMDKLDVRKTNSIISE